MGKKREKIKQEVFDSLMDLQHKIDATFGDMMTKIPNMSEEERKRLEESGVLDRLKDSMVNLNESTTKLQETIKKKK